MSTWMDGPAHDPSKCVTCWEEQPRPLGQDILPAESFAQGSPIPARRTGRYLPDCLTCGAKSRPDDLMVAAGRYWIHQYCAREGSI